jgi:hypothetical protein
LGREAEKPVEFSDYLHSLKLRRGLIMAIWLPIVLGTMILAVALPDIFASSATFQI